MLQECWASTVIFIGIFSQCIYLIYYSIIIIIMIIIYYNNRYISNFYKIFISIVRRYRSIGEKEEKKM